MTLFESQPAFCLRRVRPAARGEIARRRGHTIDVKHALTDNTFLISQVDIPGKRISTTFFQSVYSDTRLGFSCADWCTYLRLSC